MNPDEMQMVTSRWLCHHPCSRGRGTRSGEPCRHICCRDGIAKPSKVHSAPVMVADDDMEYDGVADEDLLDAMKMATSVASTLAADSPQPGMISVGSHRAES
ncbi:hypothetical protein F4677DRAFT_363252 [Hypoxylon crocopeplum]|nr:hypothetical protein F4677DRAFT_363252 [Hypoxylon crocopeplum]